MTVIWRVILRPIVLPVGSRCGVQEALMDAVPVPKLLSRKAGKPLKLQTNRCFIAELALIPFEGCAP